MIWDFAFNRDIRNRGKKYYNQKKVRDLKMTDPGKFSASIRGSRVYKTVVVFEKGILAKGSCTCPYFAGGYACKHMAAMCIAIDENIKKNGEFVSEETVNKKNDRKLNLIKDTDLLSEMGDNYYYFDLTEILENVNFKESSLLKAKKLVEKKELTLSAIEMKSMYDYDRSERVNYLNAVGFMTNKDGKRRQVGSLLLTKHDIESISCHEGGCNKYYQRRTYSWYDRENSIELCAHQLGMLLLMIDYIIKVNPGDVTDDNAKSFMKLFNKSKNRQSLTVKDSPAGMVSLVPRLEFNENGLFLGYRIGTGRMYVVKSIPDLVKEKENGGVLPLGKNNQINFMLEDFDEASKPHYELIKKVIDQEKRRNEFLMQSYRYAETGTFHISSQIPLTGEALDEFYRLNEGKSIEIKDRVPNSNYTDRKLILAEAKPEIEMVLRDAKNERGQFEGLSCLVTYPYVFKGLKDSYFIDREGLHKMPEDYAGIVGFFDGKLTSGTYSYCRETTMMVGREHLSEFYQRIIPQLSDHVAIYEDKDTCVENYLPEEAEYHFYLDYQNKTVLGKAQAQYQAGTCDIADYKKVESKDIPSGSDSFAVVKARENFRDIFTEKNIYETMEELFEGFDLENNEYYIAGEEKVFDFLTNGFERLTELGEIHVTDRFKNINIKKQRSLNVGVSVESDLLNLQIGSGDLSPEELMEILKSYRLKKKYHRLKNGDFLEINESSMEELSMLLDSMHISPKEFVEGKMHLPLYRAFYMDKMLEANEEIYSNRDKTFKTLVKDFKTVKDSDYEEPQSLNATMRNYQKYGFKWLKTLSTNGFGGILADDMGLGKTLQIIAYLLSEKEDRPVDDQGDHCALIVTPASLIYNWEEEFHKFAPSMKVAALAGSPAERKALLENKKDYDALITSYHLLSRDITNYEDKHFAYHVIDEAQFIKNKNTGISKAVRLIKSTHRFALTGTPIENRLSELWTIFDFLMPGFLYGYDVFRREMETPIVKEKDEEAMKRLKRMITTFVLRRLKQDVLKDLPDKLEEVRYAQMEKKQRQLYDAQVAHMLDTLQTQSEEDFKKNKVQILAELTKIRQICCDPSLLMENYKGGSAKNEALMDLIDQSMDGGHRLLIFSQFTSMLAILEDQLKQKKIPYYVITGATPKKARLEMVKAFNEDETPIFLISLKAGGTGLNLIGADCVVHYDPWWNVAVQNQATDRAHRIGQTKVVNVYKLIIKDSIEEKIIALQETKKNLAEEILSGDMGSMGSLSKEELMELFS